MKSEEQIKRLQTAIKFYQNEIDSGRHVELINKRMKIGLAKLVDKMRGIHL